MNLIYNVYFELSASIFMVFICVFTVTHFNTHIRRNKIFFHLELLVLLTEVADIISAIGISNVDTIPTYVNLFINTVYCICTILLAYQFLVYGTEYRSQFSEEHRVNLWGQLIILIYVVLLIVNIFTGWIFDFEQGQYIAGPLYVLMYIVPYFFFVLSSFHLVKTIIKVDAVQKFSIITYVLVSLSGAVLQIAFFPHILLTMFTISVAVVVLLFALETPEYEKLVQAMKELNDATEKAQNANEAKSLFLANMSHEIRTPINAVLGMDELIIRECEDKNILGYAYDIQSAGNSLLAIINDILDFSKIESGKLEILPVEYDVRTSLDEVVILIRDKAVEKQLDLNVIIDSSIPSILEGDVTRIKQIMTNLLNNAVKYTSEGTITLRVKWEEKTADEILLIISVEDTGMGISEEDQKRLFNTFERVDEERNRNIEGSGLGLAITKKLAGLMNGEVGVYSKLGSGSLFYVEIPQKIINSEPIGEYGETSSSTKERVQYKEKFVAPDVKVLVVDDVKANLLVVKGLLKKTQVQVDVAESGMQCIEMCKKKAYDIIFLDHMMPEMDGIETLQRIKEMVSPNDKTPIIALTANALVGAEAIYREEGFDGYLSKPIKSEELEELMISNLKLNRNQ